MWTCIVTDPESSLSAPVPDNGDASLTLKERFHGGATFAELLTRPKNNAELWEAIYKRAELSAESAERAAALVGLRHILVLNEDWCGDSVNILPYLARLEECCDHIEMRMLGRDANRDLMDAHLTGKSRSIPIAIVYDEQFGEKGWWGPRPGPLQAWVLEEGLALPRPERYRQIRTWYARDRGRTVVSEVLALMERVTPYGRG